MGVSPHGKFIAFSFGFNLVCLTSINYSQLLYAEFKSSILCIKFGQINFHDNDMLVASNHEDIHFYNIPDLKEKYI